MITAQSTIAVICNLCQTPGPYVGINPKIYNTNAASTAPNNGMNYTAAQRKHANDVHRKACQLALRAGFIRVESTDNRAIIAGTNSPMHGNHICPVCSAKLRGEYQAPKKSSSRKRKKVEDTLKQEAQIQPEQKAQQQADVILEAVID